MKMDLDEHVTRFESPDYPRVNWMRMMRERERGMKMEKGDESCC